MSHDKQPNDKDELPDVNPGIGRRKFLETTSVGAIAALTGGQYQLENPDNPQEKYDFKQTAQLIGPATARPSPGSEFFDNKKRFSYVYEDLSGTRSLITESDNAWKNLNQSQVQTVFDASDLPDPTDGTHTLEDNTVYKFFGFVTSPNGIELGNATPLIGRHGATDGFIHTGGGTAIQGTDAGFFARNMYIHAPGGTLFDLTANQSTDFLVESCSFSDAAGIANIADLGTITGYRVTPFKGCNFEEFNSGITFDGTPDKIFFEGCPFRNITASNVTIVTLASTINVEIAKMSTDCYIKNVQPDTEVVRLESGGTISDYYKHINVDHDSTVTKSNILNGQIGVEEVGTVVADSFPLPDSDVGGEIDLVSPGTVVGSGSGPTIITLPTTLQNPERVIQQSDGVIEYVGKPDTRATVHALASVSGANTEYGIYVVKNGTVLTRSRSIGFLTNSSTATGATSIAQLKLTTGDTVAAALENIGGTKDLDVETLALTV